MIAKYNRMSFVWGVPGILLQIAGNILAQGAQSALTARLGLVVALVGTGLLLVGIASYALAKGRHPAWCLLALLSIIGVVMLLFLKDKAPQDQVSGS